jgi:uncharacterized membrane protein (UPF0127 family)
VILKIQKTRKIICKDLKLAESFKDRMLGLLITSNPRNLLFKTRFGIHTLLLSEPTDILILDSDLKIVKMKEGLKPNRFFFWNPRFRMVLELPNRTIKKYKLKPGMKLILKEGKVAK